jgi:hypothetical protein
MEDDDQIVMHYRPICQVRGCGQPASLKVAAPWSDGSSRELKNYGTFCQRHAEAHLDLARRKQKHLHLAEGESVGEVHLYRLVDGLRDAQLQEIG